MSRSIPKRLRDGLIAGTILVPLVAAGFIAAAPKAEATQPTQIIGLRCVAATPPTGMTVDYQVENSGQPTGLVVTLYKDGASTPFNTDNIAPGEFLGAETLVPIDQAGTPHSIVMKVDGVLVDTKTYITAAACSNAPAPVPAAGTSSYGIFGTTLVVNAPTGVTPSGATVQYKLDGNNIAVGNSTVTAGSHTLTLWVDGKQVDTDTFVVTAPTTEPTNGVASHPVWCNTKSGKLQQGEAVGNPNVIKVGEIMTIGGKWDRDAAEAAFGAKCTELSNPTPPPTTVTIVEHARICTALSYQVTGVDPLVQVIVKLSINGGAPVSLAVAGDHIATFTDVPQGAFKAEVTAQPENADVTTATFDVPAAEGCTVPTGPIAADLQCRTCSTAAVLLSDTDASAHASAGVDVVGSIDGKVYESVYSSSGEQNKLLVTFKDVPQGAFTLKVEIYVDGKLNVTYTYQVQAAADCSTSTPEPSVTPTTPSTQPTGGSTAPSVSTSTTPATTGNLYVKPHTGLDEVLPIAGIAALVIGGSVFVLRRKGKARA